MKFTKTTVLSSITQSFWCRWSLASFALHVSFPKPHPSPSKILYVECCETDFLLWLEKVVQMYFKTLFMMFAEWVTKISISASWVLKPRKIFLSGLGLSLPTTYSFMACLADVPRARMGKRAIFCLGLWAKCVASVLFRQPSSTSCYWHKCLQTPKIEVVWIFRGGKGWVFTFTVAVVLQDLLSICTGCPAFHLFWSESYSWDSCS